MLAACVATPSFARAPSIEALAAAPTHSAGLERLRPAAGSGGRTLHVSPQGDDARDGLAWASALRSVQRAADLARPGDTVLVADGTYAPVAIERGGAANQPITFRALNRWGARITDPIRDAFSIGFATPDIGFIVIEGFELVAPGVYGNGVHSRNGAHHILVRDNLARDCGQSGFQINDGDYRFVIGNVAHGNSLLMPEAGSGISLWGAKPYDSEPGFHNIVAGNRSFGNLQGPGTAMTDGNGIIIDDLRNTQAGHTGGVVTDIGYTGMATLVENNLVYRNAGAGIQVYLSNNVVVRNNTAWLNQLRRTNETWRGNLNVSASADVVFANNVSVASSSPTVDGGATPWPGFGAISALGAFGLTGNAYSARITFAHNLTFDLHRPTTDSLATELPGGAPTLVGNRFARDPRFVAPGASPQADFRLRHGSPALDAGTAAHGLPESDFDGRPRVDGVVDLGAFEHDYRHADGFEPAGG